MSESSNEIIKELWNETVTPESYVTKEKYQDHLFEQYKICIEMADRVSARRSLANSFFLTLHTLIIGGAAFLYEKGPQLTHKWMIVFPLAAVLLLCYVWQRLLKSYKQLNRAKYKIIGEYETKLPSSPYWSAEWKKALGGGKDRKLYKSLTKVEIWVPWVFACLYLLGAIVYYWLL